MRGQDLAARLRPFAGARDALGAPGVHHHPPVGFLFITHADHEDAALQAEHRAGHRQRAPPLAGAGFRREALHPEDLVEVSLWNGRVGFVRPGRTRPFIFVVDLHRGVENLLEIVRTAKGARTPDQVLVEDVFGNVDPPLPAHLLLDEVHRKDRRQVLRRDRFPRSRVKGRAHRFGHVRLDVVPLLRNFVIRQYDLGCFHHLSPSCSFVEFPHGQNKKPNRELLESDPAGVVFKGFAIAHQSIGRKIPVRVSYGNGNDDLLVFREMGDLSQNLGIRRPLIFNAGAEAKVHRGQAKGLHGRAEIEQGAGIAQASIRQDQNRRGGIEKTESPLQPCRPALSIFPADVHEPEQLLRELDLPRPVNAVTGPTL